MALTGTTLSAAVGVSDTLVPVAATTGATAPNFTTGSGITYLWVDQEMMLVLSLVGTTAVNVQRGIGGTQAQSHASGAVATFGLPTDFAGQDPPQSALVPSWASSSGYGAAPLALRAAAIQAVSLVSVASNATISSNIAAFFAEVANTLIQMNVWKGGA